VSQFVEAAAAVTERSHSFAKKTFGSTLRCEHCIVSIVSTWSIVSAAHRTGKAMRLLWDER
jgi:hypothetical protein